MAKNAQKRSPSLGQQFLSISFQERKMETQPGRLLSVTGWKGGSTVQDKQEKRSLLCALQKSLSGSSSFSVPKAGSHFLQVSRLVPPKLFIELVSIVVQCICVLWLDVRKHFFSTKIHHSQVSQQLSHLLSTFTSCHHFQKLSHRS